VKVVQITRQLASAGGIETYVDKSSRELDRAGHDVVVLTGDECLGTRPYAVIQVPELRQESSADLSGVVRALVKAERADVAIIHHLGNVGLNRALSTLIPIAEFVHGFVCRGAKLFRRSGDHCTHVVSPRCLFDWYRGPCGSNGSPRAAWQSLRSATQQLEAISVASRVFVPSQFIRSYLASEGIDPTRIDVVDLASSVGLGRTHRASKSDEVSVLFAGRLVSTKGADHAIDAIACLPRLFSLSIAGDGWLEPSLRERVARKGLTDRVHFLGALSSRDMAGAYEKAQVLVVPSLWPEPAGIVVAEARAHGLPVVAYDSGGLAEWSELGGVELVERGNVDKLAIAIRKAASEPDSRSSNLRPRGGIYQTLESVIDKLYSQKHNTERE
jgi:glycosyltransferase involved in cell wall biosynthesis